jgi:hypothetical protein
VPPDVLLGVLHLLLRLHDERLRLQEPLLSEAHHGLQELHHHREPMRDE